MKLWSLPFWRAGVIFCVGLFFWALRCIFVSRKGAASLKAAVFLRNFEHCCSVSVAFRRMGAVVVCFCAFASPAHSETIQQALASAFENNPKLLAEQARLRGTDEEVARAHAGWRPNVTVDGQVGSEKTNTRPGSVLDGRTNPYGYSVTVNQPLFRGFRTLNGVKQAKATVMAGRANLRLVEQSVLLDAATAFMNVVREKAVLRLRTNNVAVLAKQLKATEDRFAVGEVTTTDVAQARARRSEAVSRLNLAQANLKTALAEYRRVIGHDPSRLGRPGSIRKYLPKNQERAVQTALDEHPSIGVALYQEQAARHNVQTIMGERLPEVNLEAQYSQNFDTTIATDEREVGSITGRVRMPLYQGGEVYARIRQAKQIVLQRQAELNQARLQVRSNAISAWGQLQAARAQVEANNQAVRSNGVALNGVREEEKVGQRTILDVLDAEQAYLDSQVALVTAQRDAVVAEYNLLSTLGRLSVTQLPISTVHYDPVENFVRVERKWRGGDINHLELDETRLFYADDVFSRRERTK